MFEKSHLDALFSELKADHGYSPGYDRLLKNAHLAIALFDADRPLGDDIAERVAALVEKHRPAD